MASFSVSTSRSKTTTPEQILIEALQALVKCDGSAGRSRGKDCGTQSEMKQAVEEVQEDVYTVKNIVDTEDFACLVSNLPELMKNFSKLDAKITQLLMKKFSNGESFIFL